MGRWTRLAFPRTYMDRQRRAGFLFVLPAVAYFACVYFIPLAVSLVAAALIWQWLYEPVYGVLNHVLVLVGLPPQKWLQSLNQVLPSLAAINVWVRLGFDTMIFLAALQAIPE